MQVFCEQKTSLRTQDRPLGERQIYLEYFNRIFCNIQSSHKSSVYNLECSEKYKTISDGGITVDFSIIKVHTSN